MGEPTPTIAEYNKAISSQGSGVFKTLRGLSFIPSRTIPVKIFSFGAGSYAVVFKANDGFGQYAIRCFISSAEENLIRYKKISYHLRYINDSWKTSFEIIDDEILVNGKFYPVLKMEWIEGQLINNYVSHVLNNNQAISELQKEIVSISKSLESNQVGHGDIQCGNILITKDVMGLPKIKLIDYDGMYIPEFKYQSNLEKGRSEFQHPKRTQYDFNEKMDRFPFWVMITALEALKYDKSLWLEVMQGGFNTLDNFLFLGDDFKNPFNSKLFNRLNQINQPSLNYYVTKLKNFCLSEISEVTELELFDNNTPIESINSADSNQSGNSYSNIFITNQPSSIDLSNAEKALQIRAKLKSNSFDKISKLEILKEGFDAGLINENEYEILKDEVLSSANSSNSLNGSSNNTNQLNSPPVSNNKKITVIVVIGLLILVSLLTYLFISEKSNSGKTEIQTSAIDSPYVQQNNEDLSATTNVINDWLLKSTGYNFNIDATKILFSTEYFNNNINGNNIKRIDISSPTGETNNLIPNPNIIYFNDYIEIVFDNGWIHHIFITSTEVLYSVHMGSNSTTMIYDVVGVNRKGTPPSDIQSYEVQSIRGKEANVVSSYHDEQGTYQSEKGILNLIDFTVKWENSEKSEQKVNDVVVTNSKENRILIKASRRFLNASFSGYTLYIVKEELKKRGIIANTNASDETQFDYLIECDASVIYGQGRKVDFDLSMICYDNQNRVVFSKHGSNQDKNPYQDDLEQPINESVRDIFKDKIIENILHGILHGNDKNRKVDKPDF